MYLTPLGDGGIVVQGAAGAAVWFDETPTGFVPHFPFERKSLERSGSLYILRDNAGNVTEFDAFTKIFRRQTDAAGNTLEVTALAGNGYNLARVVRTYTAGGETTEEEFVYDYGTETGDSLLSQVTLRRRVNAGAWTNVQSALYTYYVEGAQYGNEGDLQTVVTRNWNGTAWVETGTSYYRYWLDSTSGGSSSSSSSSSSASPGGDGFPLHALKFVINPASFVRLAADPNVTDPLTASDMLVSQFADYYYEYTPDQRVSRETVQSGSQTETFEIAFSGFSDGYNRWTSKTTVSRDDGSQEIVFSNFAGQTMLKVLQKDDLSWCHFWKLGESGIENGRVVLHANPSAISDYDEQYPDLLHAVDGNYEFLRDYEGKLDRCAYHDPSGYISAEMIQHGERGDCFLLRKYAYAPCCPAGGPASPSSSSSSSSSGAPADLCLYHLVQKTEYPDDGLPCGSSSSSSSSAGAGGCINAGTRQIITTYARTFWPGTCAMQQRTTNLPVIPIEQNGSGLPTSRRDYFDIYGNNTWRMDARGFLIRTTYDIPTGAVLQVINDVDTSQVDNAPPGWETPTGGGLHLFTDFQIDDLGRTTHQLGPERLADINGVATLIREAMWTVYRDDIDQVWSASGYQKVSDGSFVLANPVGITITDRQGKVLERIKAVRLSGGSSSSSSSMSSGSAIDPTTVPVYSTGKLTAQDSFPQWTYVARETTQYTDCCFVASRRMYKLIPAYGPGIEGTNYDQINVGYDALKRQIRSTTGGGTITRNVLDPRGLVLSAWVGTNDDGATPEDPAGGGAPGNNMVMVNSTEYDGGVAGGDGNPTAQTAYVDDSTMRVKVNIFDWRNRQIKRDGEVDLFVEFCHDNLDRQYRTQRRDTTASGNLIARSETSFDDRSQVYQTRTYGVDPATGTVGYALTDNNWRDASGNVIKSLPSGSKAFIKVMIDGAGRQTKQYIGYDLHETDYDDIFNVTGDTILQQTETAYDSASNLIQTNVRHRYHNATGTGELGTPSSTQPKARVTYAAMYPDPLGRTTATAEYGTNGAAALSRPDTIPARAEDCLVTSLTFDAAGRQYGTTDPADRTDKFFYDAMGRELLRRLNAREVISSSSSSSSSCSSGTCGCGPSADTNVDTLTRYNADGNVQFLTAVNSSTGDQTTEFVYGSTLADSGIASSLLKVQEIYPDSEDEDDMIRFGYNRQGQLTQKTDQNATIHEYEYDLLGREIEDRITTPGPEIDTSILRIGKTYEVRGMIEYVTSYDESTIGTGNIVNQVLFIYDAFGQIVRDCQSHEGSVDLGTTPEVAYGYSDGSDNTTRQQTLTYPSGRVLYRDYGASGSMADAMSRVDALVDDDGIYILASYSYLGVGTAVITEYQEAAVQLTMIGTNGGNDPTTGDIYYGFDRFGRIKDNYWYGEATDVPVDRVRYGYDLAGNRIWKENVVAAALDKAFDESYVNDKAQRLEIMQRGILNASKAGIEPTSVTFGQCWQLDSTGNASSFHEDPSHAGQSVLQERMSNRVNEIVQITNSVGASWVTPLYDRAGNMTAIPDPDNLTASIAASYDAWHRLASLERNGGILSLFSYDGLTRLTSQASFEDETATGTRELYYTEPASWQMIEERSASVGTETTECVWGVDYPDNLILRERGNGERLFALHDANWNIRQCNKII